jgi:L-ribulose-5-phosphate 3-epimerase
MPFGFPQDWILTLGARIKRVHLKDYKAGKQGGGTYVPLTEGDVNWKEVMAAFVKVGYRGTLSPEYAHDPKDPDQVLKISRGIDKILAMA